MADTQTTLLTWVGPAGHTSQLFGDLLPGKSYACPTELAAALVQMPSFWQAKTTTTKKEIT